jgi:hypothetical protein
MPHISSLKPISSFETYEPLSQGLYEMLVKAVAMKRHFSEVRTDEPDLSKVVSPKIINELVEEQVRITNQMILSCFLDSRKEIEICCSRKINSLEVDLFASMKPTAISNTNSLNYKSYIRNESEIGVIAYVFTATESEIINQFLFAIKNLAIEQSELDLAINIIELSKSFLLKLNLQGMTKSDLSLADLINFLAYGDFDDFIDGIRASYDPKLETRTKADFSELCFKFRLSTDISL